ncbi:MAG: M23 family metallopeptidase [Spirochaetaceae bacterium]|nr:MAG: M23 family metallopeptidase [Spirochaetaceae bacterium]
MVRFNQFSDRLQHWRSGSCSWRSIHAGVQGFAAPRARAADYGVPNTQKGFPAATGGLYGCRTPVRLFWGGGTFWCRSISFHSRICGGVCSGPPCGRTASFAGAKATVKYKGSRALKVRTRRGQHYKATSYAFIALAFLTFNAGLYAQYPEIRALNNSDPVFRQHQEGVNEYYRAAARNHERPPLMVYQVRPRQNDTLLSIAARFSLPYSAIASLNRLDSPEIPHTHEFLLVPSMPGLFVPTEPETDLEFMLANRLNQMASSVRVNVSGSPVSFSFKPGEDFSSEERLAFLRALFRSPLLEFRVSSPYGFRRSPFTGAMSFHNGVDLVAPMGTNVHAARSGRVIDAGYDAVYGQYVLLQHGDGYESLYGHLGRIVVDLEEQVRAGAVIGEVGSTGLSTGAHLHFEIRLNGVPRDPMQLLPRSGR